MSPPGPNLEPPPDCTTLLTPGTFTCMRTPVLASDGDEAGTMLTTSIYNVDDEVRRQFGGVATIDHAVQSDDRKSRFAAAARRHYHSMTSLDGSDDVIATAREARRFQNVILATFQSSKKFC